MPVLQSFFAWRDFSRNSRGAHLHYELSGCGFFLVLLVATDLGRTETPLRRSGAGAGGYRGLVSAAEVAARSDRAG